MEDELAGVECVVDYPGTDDQLLELDALSDKEFARLWHATFDDDVRYQTCAHKECTFMSCKPLSPRNFPHHYFDETRGEPVRRPGVKKNARPSKRCRRAAGHKDAGAGHRRWLKMADKLDVQEDDDEDD